MNFLQQVQQLLTAGQETDGSSYTRDRHFGNFTINRTKYISYKMRDVKGFLSKKQSEGGPLASEWVALGELYEKK